MLKHHAAMFVLLAGIIAVPPPAQAQGLPDVIIPGKWLAPSAPAATGRMQDLMRGKWVDSVHGEAEWFWQFRPDGTFVQDHRVGMDLIEGTYRYSRGLLTFRWTRKDGRRDVAWGKVLSVDNRGLRFRYTEVKSRLAQAPIVHLVRPGTEEEVYSTVEIEQAPVLTRKLMRLHTGDGRRLVGTIVDSSKTYIMFQTKGGLHKVRRRDIKSLTPAKALHAQ